MPLERALSLLELAIPFPDDVLHAKNLAGKWVQLHQLLLPGVLFASDSGEVSALVDLEWHGLDEAILKHFGATDAPRAGYKYQKGNFYFKRLLVPYWKDASKKFYQEAQRRPQEKNLEFYPMPPTTGPLDAFSRLSDAGQARFCQHLTQTAFEDAPWIYLHSSAPDAYPKIEREAPSIYLLREMGVLPTSRGPRAINDCFAPALSRWSTWLSIAQVSPEIAAKLELRADFSTLTRAELQSLGELLGSVTNGRLLSEFYAACARVGMKSVALRCRREDQWIEEDAAKVVVASDPKITTVLQSLRIPFLEACEPDAATLVARWKMVTPNFVREVSFEASSDATELLSFFPSLWAIASDEIMGLMLQPCSQLGERVSLRGGVRVLPHDFLREENTLFHRADLPRDQLLRHIFAALETPVEPSTQQELETAARHNNDEAREVELALKVRRVKSMPEKLLLCAGEKALKSHLPSGLVKAIGDAQGKAPDATQLAELALAVYGVETLHEFRTVLSTKGLRPPGQWAGTHGARRFVADLGFPATFAGFEGARRPRVEEVEGPPQLPVAHAYQSAMMSSIRGLLGNQAKRGLLALPTGAGKTRVAVEALVDAIRGDGLTQGAQSGPILWIAQSDELCEQAVATWKTLWRAKGTGARLTISRLWGQNDADELPDSVQVVVATIDKLKTCVEKSEYSWLSRPCFVVIDEAHGATTPEYTACLGWLGLSWRDRVNARDRCPLLGLTATAFRGNEAETKRLVDRFGGTRLDGDELGDDPLARLQELGVLARVQHRKLDGDEITVTAKDLEELRTFRRLSSKVEEKLGGNAKRNARLLAAIEELDAEWPILLFATSVSHAQTMAALLTLRGIPARAISGQTPPAARRHYIQEFREGKIRVLTNFNVLTIGFDAPAVRCVMVARPVYSAGLYQQMIGRGLRGPANGGKAECLIIDVVDNITNYDGSLAFRGFDYLWNEETAELLESEAAPPTAATSPESAHGESVWFLNLEWDAACPHQNRARQQIQKLINEHPLADSLGHAVAKDYIGQYANWADKAAWSAEMVEQIETQITTSREEPENWEAQR